VVIEEEDDKEKTESYSHPDELGKIKVGAGSVVGGTEDQGHPYSGGYHNQSKKAPIKVD